MKHLVKELSKSSPYAVATHSFNPNKSAFETLDEVFEKYEKGINQLLLL